MDGDVVISIDDLLKQKRPAPPRSMLREASVSASAPAPASVKLPLVWEVGEEVRPEELVRARPRGAMPAVERIRTTHHEIARLLAVGLKVVEVSASTGYTPERIHGLKNDPAFQELLAYYQERRTQEVLQFDGKIRSAAMDTLEVWHDRVMDAPEEIDDKDLVRATVELLDRAGHSPVRKQATLHMGLTAEQIGEIKRRAEGAGVALGGMVQGALPPPEVEGGEGEGDSV